MELSAYRIVQEALSNVVRHAPGARTRVEVELLPDRTALTVAGRQWASPAALLGFAWRPAVPGRASWGYASGPPAGGALATGPTLDGGFQVTASTSAASPSRKEKQHMTIRVVVVDDQAMVRAGLHRAC